MENLETKPIKKKAKLWHVGLAIVIVLMVFSAINDSFNKTPAGRKALEQDINDEYYEKISTLVNGTYLGYSTIKTSDYFGAPQPSATGRIYIDGKKLKKKYEAYTPQVANTGVVFGWKGPETIVEYGEIKSPEISWFDNRLLVMTNWEAPTFSSKSTFNVSLLTKGDYAGKLYATMFTDHWQVWGYKEIEKDKSKELLVILKEWYKKVNGNKEPWKTTNKE